MEPEKTEKDAPLPPVPPVLAPSEPSEKPPVVPSVPAPPAVPPAPAPPAVPPAPVASIPEAKEVTKQRALDIKSLVAKYVDRHTPPPKPPMSRSFEPPRALGAHARLLPLMRLIPWTLAVLFGLSFLWDFPGLTLSVFGFSLPLTGLLRILSVSGLIGFATNWLAITMLFNPREKRPLLGQGLIPAQRERVIFRLAKAVSEELINEEIIKQKIEEHEIIPRYRELALTITRGVIEDPDFRAELKVLTSGYVEEVLSSDTVRRRLTELISEKIEEHAGEGIGGLALKTYRFLNEQDFQRRIDRAIHELPSSIDSLLDELDQLLDRIPTLIEARSEDIEAWATRVVLGFVENLDVYAMIMGNMESYDERQLEDLLKKTTNEQLTYIKYLGGVLGFFGGFLIWKPALFLTLFGTLALLLWGLDEALYRAAHKPDAGTPQP